MSPEELQSNAVHYFRTMPLPVGVIVETWSVDEDSRATCETGHVSECPIVGYVFIGDKVYCPGHASIMIDSLPSGPRRHIAVDVARPIIPTEIKAPDVIETTIAFLRYVVDRSGSTVTVDMARRASGLISLLEKARES